jgi:Sjoegren syndrome nuclear autoantigen 1
LWLAAGIEDLREKREQIMKQIQDEEMEKQRVQQELAALTQRLSRVNESLARKVGAAS